jgi:hypothetical protein
MNVREQPALEHAIISLRSGRLDEAEQKLRNASTSGQGTRRRWICWARSALNSGAGKKPRTT